LNAPDNPPLPDLETPVQSTIRLETTLLLSLVVAVLSLFLFAWIAENVSHQRTQNFDLAVRTQIHQYASPALTRLMIATSFLGSRALFVFAVISLVFFLHHRWRRAAIWLAVTLAGALVLELTLKFAFHRPRPTPFFVPTPSTYSFPSGHALFSFCFYGVLAGLLSGRIRSLPLRVLIWTLAALLVLAIGLSRIYLGVHYPSDVIAGYLTASLWVGTMVAVDRWRTRRKNYRS
jgi:undecaprenyl-diphosphatase